VPVVINEFEVLSAPPAEPRPSAPAAAADTTPAEKIEPCAVAHAVRVLAVRALRTWAH
jgi:hypothetical protein